MKNKTCPGKPVLQDSDQLRDLVERDPFQSTREMSITLATTHTTIENGLLKTLIFIATQVPQEASTTPQEGSPAQQDQIIGSRTIQIIERQQLPKIPKFRGNSWEFSNFWALFEEVMEQSDWSELVKFNKLLESLESDPRMIVSKYISSENKFKMASIISKYNKKASSQSTKDQRQMLDRILCLTTQLKDLKENIESRMLKEEEEKGRWRVEITKILEDLEVIISNEEELNRYRGRDDAQRPK
ncbi:unnamed protein product [Caenorhabditis nigoni]